MDGRRARMVHPELNGVARLTEAGHRPAGLPAGQLTRGWAAALGLGLPLAVVLAVAIEPAPAEPQAGPAPILVELAALVFVAALATSVLSAALRHRLAAVAGAAAGLVAVTFTVTCPVSGHHTYGLWWVGQLGLGLAMVAVSLAALGRWARATT